jgi:CheY-like chemotaxis protein
MTTSDYCILYRESGKNIGHSLIRWYRTTRLLMCRMLTRLGHRVSTAENGEIALRMIKDCWEDKLNALHFDVVFLDK